MSILCCSVLADLEKKLEMEYLDLIYSSYAKESKPAVLDSNVDILGEELYTRISLDGRRRVAIAVVWECLARRMTFYLHYILSVFFPCVVSDIFFSSSVEERNRINEDLLVCLFMYVFKLHTGTHTNSNIPISSHTHERNTHTQYSHAYTHAVHAKTHPRGGA